MIQNKTLLSIFILLLICARAQSAVDLSEVNKADLLDLKQKLPQVFGPSPSIETLDEAIRLIYLTGTYESVVLERFGNDYRIQTKPLRTVKKITVIGAKVFEDSELIEEVGLQEGQPLGRIAGQGIAESIKEKYGKSGYLNTVVSFEIKELNRTDAEVIVTIKENLPTVVKDIQFNSANATLVNELKKRVHSRLGKPIDEDAMRDTLTSLERYLLENRYLNTSITGPEIRYSTTQTQATLIFNIERPFKFVLYYEGNQSLSTSEINRYLELNDKGVSGLNPTQEIQTRIERIYLERGYAHVTSQISERVYPKDFSRVLNINIQEGPRVSIGKVDVVGTYSLDKDFYVDTFIDAGANITQSGYYSREDLEKSSEGLIYELQNRGFIQSKIKNIRTEYSAKKDRANITIWVEEGPQTLVQTIAISGPKAFKPEVILEKFGLQSKKPLALKELEEGLRRVILFYAENGYLEMQVTNEKEGLIEYSENNTRATIRLDIKEGPQISVGQIVVEGNKKTKDRVVLSEIDFKVGDILTPENVSYSEYRLQRLNLFSEVSISTLERNSPVEKRTVVIKVTERDPGLFSTGLGANTEFDLTLRGFLGVSYRNLGGTARAASARVEVKRITDVDFFDFKIYSSYLEPYLFRSHIRGRVNVGWSRSIVERDKQLDQTLASETTELELQLEREFRHLKLIMNAWSLQISKTFEIDEKRAPEDIIVGSLGPIIELDYRDSPFNPTSGTFSRLTFEYASPELGSSYASSNSGGSEDITFLKTTAGFNYYLPLKGPRWVWANSVRGGYVKNLEPTSGVPESRMFSLGGRSTIRGFEPSEIPLREYYQPDDEAAYFLKTESFFYLLKTEFRFPIYGDFGGAVFYDGGLVHINDKDVEIPDEYRDSVGVGFRYNTPVGPVSAEYGYRLDRHRSLGEPQGRFHFSIGTF